MLRLHHGLAIDLNTECFRFLDLRIKAHEGLICLGYVVTSFTLRFQLESRLNLGVVVNYVSLTHVGGEQLTRVRAYRLAQPKVSVKLRMLIQIDTV